MSNSSRGELRGELSVAASNKELYRNQATEEEPAEHILDNEGKVCIAR